MMARRRQAGNCFYCGRQLFQDSKHVRANRRGVVPFDAVTVDHVIPQAKMHLFGPWSIEQCQLNQVPCCHPCNNRKGPMLPVYWVELIRLDRQQAFRDLVAKLPIKRK